MEFVLVVPRTMLFPESYPHGLVLFDEAQPAEAVHACVDDHGFFVEREHAERTPSLKQVIPYSIVVRHGRGYEPEVLCLRRTTKGGESRLHDKLSIGVGGHINPVDKSPLEGPDGARGPDGSQGPDGAQEPDGSQGPEGSPGPKRRAAVIAAATQREVFEEELIIDGSCEIRDVGLLNDDSNPVGAVHVGFVQVITVEGSVRVREVDQLEGSFRSPSSLKRMLAEGANFETWSSLLIPDLDHLVSSSVATPS